MTIPDKRKEPRYRVNKHGSIRCLVTQNFVDVKIKDLSASGARLAAKSHTLDMLDVELHIHAEDLRVPAQIKWRFRDEVGVAMLNSGATIKGKG